MMYQLSKDYNALFDLLLKGEEPVCFVDNKHDESPRVARDVCRVRRAREYNIIAVSRGTIYFSVDPWLKEESALSEREIFCGICDGVNLEWIVPTVRPAMNMVDMARIEEAARALWQEWHEGIDAAAWDDGYVPTMSVQWETAFLAGARWRDRQDAVELEAVKSQLLNVYTEEQATERVRRAVEANEAYLKSELERAGAESAKLRAELAALKDAAKGLIAIHRRHKDLTVYSDQDYINIWRERVDALAALVGEG